MSPDNEGLTQLVIVSKGSLVKLRAKQKTSSKRRRLPIVAAVIVAVVGGTVAYASAAVPSADNMITGCYTTGYPLRIIDTDASQKCAAGEQTLSWGGGMRFRGVWKDGPGPGVPPAGLYQSTKKGDVIRFEGTPINKFGCTSPKGSWVSVAGSYAYPCLEFPQNWAPLALDGATGSNADAHWVSLNANGTLRAASDTGIVIYTGVGYAYVSIPTVPDPSKCGLSATTTAYTSRVTTTAQISSGYILVATRDLATGAFTAAPIDLTVTCAKYS
jgi:hypothetical protein